MNFILCFLLGLALGIILVLLLCYRHIRIYVQQFHACKVQQVFHNFCFVLLGLIILLSCFGTHIITKIKYESALKSCKVKLQNYADTFITPLKKGGKE